MNSLFIIGIILLVLFLLCQVRIGAVLEYNQNGLQICARLGPRYIKVYPRLKKKEKNTENSKQPDKKQKLDAGTAEKHGKKLTLEQLLGLAERFIPLLLEAAGCLWKKIIMDELNISVTVGSSDPADAAMLYGQINSGVAALWVPLNEVFHVKNGRAHVGVDFETNSMALYVKTAISIKIGQVVWLALYFGIKALKQLIQYRKTQKRNAQERKAV